MSDRVPAVLKQSSPASHPMVLLIEEPAIEFRVTRRGALSPGARCQLTISINDGVAASFLEEGGPRAPRAAVIGVTAPPDVAEPLLDALRTRPWVHPDTPIVAYSRTAREGRAAGAGTQPVDYLVISGAVAELIRAIRSTLDLECAAD